MSDRASSRSGQDAAEPLHNAGRVPDSEDMTDTATPAPTTIREALDELGYYITEAGDSAEVAADFPGWLIAKLHHYDAVTITENSRRVAAVTIDDDEGLTIYLFGNTGVLLTSPINCQADAMGTVCFLAVAAEIARF